MYIAYHIKDNIKLEVLTASSLQGAQLYFSRSEYYKHLPIFMPADWGTRPEEYILLEWKYE